MVAKSVIVIPHSALVLAVSNVKPIITYTKQAAINVPLIALHAQAPQTVHSAYQEDTEQHALFLVQQYVQIAFLHINAKAVFLGVMVRHAITIVLLDVRIYYVIRTPENVQTDVEWAITLLEKIVLNVLINAFNAVTVVIAQPARPTILEEPVIGIVQRAAIFSYVILKLEIVLKGVLMATSLAMGTALKVSSKYIVRSYCFS